MTLPHVIALADNGYRVALGKDPHLRAGLNVHEGRITYKAVADALKLPYVPAEQALRM
jgi:alanine dehydrogenase